MAREQPIESNVARITSRVPAIEIEASRGSEADEQASRRLGAGVEASQSSEAGVEAEWSSGLHRNGVYYEGVVDDVEQILEHHRKDTVTSYGTRSSTKHAVLTPRDTSNKEKIELSGTSKVGLFLQFDSECYYLH